MEFTLGSVTSRHPTLCPWIIRCIFFSFFRGRSIFQNHVAFAITGQGATCLPTNYLLLLCCFIKDLFWEYSLGSLYMMAPRKFSDASVLVRLVPDSTGCLCPCPYPWFEHFLGFLIQFPAFLVPRVW